MWTPVVWRSSASLCVVVALVVRGCTGQLSVASPQVTQDCPSQHGPDVGMLFQHVLDVQIRDVSWDLASVPLSSGGLGLKCLHQSQTGKLVERGRRTGHDSTKALSGGDSKLAIAVRLFQSLFWSPVTHAKSVLVQHTRARLMLHFLSKLVKQTLIQCPRAVDALSSVFLHVLFVSGHVNSTSRISERKGPSLGGPRFTCAFIHVQGLCTSDCVSVTQKKNSGAVVLEVHFRFTSGSTRDAKEQPSGSSSARRILTLCAFAGN